MKIALITIFLALAMLFAMTPCIFWGYNNYIKLKRNGDVPYHMRKRLRMSWIYCYLMVLIMFLAAVMVAYI